MTAKPNKEMTQQPIAEVVTQALAPSVDINKLFDKAIEAGSPLEVLRELISLSAKIQTDFAEAQLNKALGKFQSQYPAISRDTEGHNWKYAPLEHIADKIKAPLEANGLSFTFNTDTENEVLTQFCTIHHIDGGSRVSKYSTPITPQAGQNKNQEVGTANSYAKRYALCNGLGIIIGGEDDDGGPPPEPITQEEAHILGRRIAEYVHSYENDEAKATKTVRSMFRQLARAAGAKGDGPILEAIPSTMFEEAKTILAQKIEAHTKQREKSN